MVLQIVVPEAGKVTCLHADEVSRILWAGHSDGKVSAHSLDAFGTAINPRPLYCWQVLSSITPQAKSAALPSSPPNKGVMRGTLSSVAP